jgi:hypothetical protein
MVCAAGACVSGTTPPAPPTGVVALPGNGTVTLSWNAVPGATGYDVYVSTTPDAATGGTKVPVGAATQAAMQGLANGGAYWFAVTSTNSAGESAPSAVPCAVPTAASTAGLTLYDPLCATSLDASKWASPGTRSWSIDRGAASLYVEHADIPSRGIQNDIYATILTVNAAGHRVTTLVADVSIDPGASALDGSVQLRAPLRLTYQPPAYRLQYPGGLLDWLGLEVGLIETPRGLFAYRNVSHCDNASCNANSATGVAVVDPVMFGTIFGLSVGAPASYGTVYKVTTSLDETTGVFHWSIAGGEFGSAGVSGTADFAAYLAATPGWSGVPLAGAGFVNAQLAVRELDTSGGGGGTGRITARFDDVQVGLDDGAPTAFDDFGGSAGNSGPIELAVGKWSDGSGGATGGSFAASALPAGGSFVIHSQTTADASNAGIDSQVLNLQNPASINAVQADVTLGTSFTGATSGRVANAFLQGRFYNTGAAGTTPPNVNEANSAVGDVMGQVWLQAVTNDARWALLRCETASCGTLTSLGSGVISGVSVGTGVHAMRLAWNPGTHVLTFTVDGQPVTVDPTVVTSGGVSVAAPYVKPANSPMRRVLTTLTTPMGAGNTGSLDVKLNNVFVATAVAQAAAPMFTPGGGSYASAQSVTISSTTPGATVHYTTDGSTPTSSSPTPSAPVPVGTGTTTLKAIATAPGHADSPIASATYVIGGTDFLSVCGAVQSATAGLATSCINTNPALFSSPGPYGAVPCTDLQKEIGAGRIVYDAAQGAACAAAAASLTCSDLLPGGGFTLPASCRAAITPTVVTGGTCYTSDDCVSGYCTGDWALTCPGTCQPFVGAGGDCSTAPCTAGLTCSFSGTGYTCVAAGGLNGACPCQDGLWCDGTGVCRAPQTGGSCTPGSSQCAVGYDCYPPVGPSACAPLVGSGSSCAANPCGLGYTCTGTCPACTCTSWPAVGQPCPALGSPCIGGYCNGTVCATYKATGAACSNSFECASASCNVGQCAPSSCSAP